MKTITATKTRKEKKEETQRKLIDSALKHFSMDGIADARTLDIARSAGVSHGTVFLHFPTREELLISVMSEFGLRVTRRMRELTDSGMGIKSVLKAHLTVLAEYEDIYSRLISETPTLPEDVQLVVISIQSAISHILFKAVEKEMTEGSIKKIPMHLLFTTWIGLIHHHLQNKFLFCRDGSLIEKKGDELLNHFMSLIKNERK